MKATRPTSLNNLKIRMWGEVATVGAHIAGAPATEHVSLFGNQNITHFDFIFTSVSAIVVDLQTALKTENIYKTTIPRQVYDKRHPIVDSKMQLLRQLVDAGTILIIFVDACLPILKIVDAGHVSSVSLHGLPIFNLMKFAPISGRAIDYCGPPIEGFKEEFERDSYSYSFELIDKSLEPVFRSPSRLESGRKVLGGVSAKPSGGAIVLVPPLEVVSATLSDRGANYFSRLHDLVAHYRAVNISTVPPWAQSLALTDEAAIIGEVAAVREQITRLESFVADQAARLALSAWHKDMVAGTGAPLERAVRQALEGLGVRCYPGPPGRADIVGRFGEKLFVIEVKGFEGGVKEGALVQCERWTKEVEAAFVLAADDWDAATRGYADILRELGYSD